MKYHTLASILVLAGLSNARPMPQFGFGSFSIPSFPLPTGGFSIPSGISLPSLSFPLPTGSAGSGGGLTSGLGSGFSIPSLGGLPSATGGLSLPTGSVDVPTTAEATPTSAAPQATSTAGGSVGSNCTPQGSGGGSTENGVADKNCCTEVTVIFARGTGELGHVGSVAGPPMFSSLRQKLGADKVTVQGVDYPADAAGNANLGASGGPAMASSVKAAKSQCPNTKIIVAGYSQGAMVVHNAFSQGVSGSDVAGAVLFGDPLKTQAVGDLATAKVKEFCATADSICGTGDNPQGSHLSYGSVGGEAADFVISAAGLS